LAESVDKHISYTDIMKVLIKHWIFWVYQKVLIKHLLYWILSRKCR
jgi:hypothetical protein